MLINLFQILMQIDPIAAFTPLYQAKYKVKDSSEGLLAAISGDPLITPGLGAAAAMKVCTLLIRSNSLQTLIYTSHLQVAQYFLSEVTRSMWTLSVEVKWCRSSRVIKRNELAMLEDSERPATTKSLEACFPIGISQLRSKRTPVGSFSSPLDSFLNECGIDVATSVTTYRAVYDAMEAIGKGNVPVAEKVGSPAKRMAAITRVSLPIDVSKRRREYHLCALSAAFEIAYAPTYRKDLLRGVVSTIRTQIFDIVVSFFLNEIGQISLSDYWPDGLCHTNSDPDFVELPNTDVLVRKQRTLDQASKDRAELDRLLKAITRSALSYFNPPSIGTDAKMTTQMQALHDAIRIVSQNMHPYGRPMLTYYFFVCILLELVGSTAKRQSWPMDP